MDTARGVTGRSPQGWLVRICRIRVGESRSSRAMMVTGVPALAAWRMRWSRPALRCLLRLACSARPAAARVSAQVWEQVASGLVPGRGQ